MSCNSGNRVRMKFVSLCLLIISLVACATDPVQEQIVIIVTATPAPNEIVVRMTFTPMIGNSDVETINLSTPQATIAEPTIKPSSTSEVFPSPVAKEIFIAEQEFERARFFWLEPAERSQSIWVLFYEKDSPVKGKWGIFEDTFEEGEVSLDPNIVPPEGFLQPIRGFGKLWRNNLELKEDVGWALEREFGYIAEYRYEYGGEVVSGEYIAAPGIHYLTTRSNKTYRFDETNFTWSLIDN